MRRHDEHTDRGVDGLPVDAAAATCADRRASDASCWHDDSAAHAAAVVVAVAFLVGSGGVVVAVAGVGLSPN